MIALKEKDSYRVGVLSDTHGMLRDCVYPPFETVDLIIHAGDVGREEVLRELKKMAPVIAVRGNTDGRWAEDVLPLLEMVSVGGVMLAVLHDLNDLDMDPRVAGVDAVISGHTHQPLIETRNGVLYLNPGSIGPRRFDYPVSAALLEINGVTLAPRILTFTP
ncbi:metallophosphoesterase family protein [Desulfococcus sp.]|uniref:metallophosphoesterase family protein n=1 Tax=Desulfococcus sp. TaxID=2025834 RepID=UPI003593EA87